MIVRGQALIEQGHIEAGITQTYQGLTHAQAIGTALFRPMSLVVLAQGHQNAGQLEEGLRILAEGLALVDANGGHWCQAELYRLQGEFLRHLACNSRYPTWTPEQCFLGVDLKLTNF